MRAPTAAEYDAMPLDTLEPFDAPLPEDQEARNARARAYNEGRLTKAEDPAKIRAAEEEAAENARQREAHERAALERAERLGLIPKEGKPAAPQDPGATDGKPEEPQELSSTDGDEGNPLEGIPEATQEPLPEATQEPLGFGVTGGNPLGTEL